MSTVVTKERLETPDAFRDLLIRMAQSVERRP